MRAMYEGRPRTRNELELRRYEKECHEKAVRRRRLWLLRLVMIAVGLLLIAIRLVDSDKIVAAGAIWACIPGE